MYASVRRYQGNAELARQLSSRSDDIRSVIADTPGFRWYYLIEVGGDIVTVSAFDDESGARQSNQAAAAWLKDNMPDVAASPHEISAQPFQIDILSRLFEVLGPGVGTRLIEGVLLLEVAPRGLSRTSLLLKRAIDLVTTAAILVLAAPLLAWIAWRIKRDSSGPILVRQTRLGLNMRDFTMLKFRTVVVDADQGSHRQYSHRQYIRQIRDKRVAPTANGLYKPERGEEITPFGRWLRRTNLEELPQLINVLKGDMSLVGPRPCLPIEIDLFEPHHFKRFSVPAGWTGLWQVTASARSTTHTEALDMDVAYARDWSLGLDLWLFARTSLRPLMKSLRTSSTASIRNQAR